MTSQPSLEQKLRMMIIDDEVAVETDPNYEGMKYFGLQERYKDIFTIDKALTFKDPRISRDYWAMFKLRDTKYDLIVLDCLFPGQRQNGWEILDEIRNKKGCCPLNTDTFVLGYSIRYTIKWLPGDKTRKLSEEEIVKRGLNARVTGVCMPGDLFAAIDKYLAEEHPERLANLR